jgi:hypothetical protein
MPVPGRISGDTIPAIVWLVIIDGGMSVKMIYAD